MGNCFFHLFWFINKFINTVYLKLFMNYLKDKIIVDILTNYYYWIKLIISAITTL
jgi:hypothetical protein